MEPLAKKLVREHQREIGWLNDDEANEVISDLLIDAGYMAELEHDAFEAEVSKMKCALYRAGHTERVEVTRFENPPAPMPVGSIFDGTLDPRDVIARIEALKRADEHGTTAVLNLKKAPAIVRKVAMRAIGDWAEASAISEKIATYLVLKQAIKLLGLALDCD